MAIETELPHWDMTVVYPSLESEEFRQGHRQVLAQIGDLSALFDRYHIERRAHGQIDQETLETFDRVVPAYSRVMTDLHTLSAYVRSFISTNSRDTVAQAQMSELQQETIPLSRLSTRLTAWLGSLDVEQLLERSELARSLAFTLRKTKVEAEHQMSLPLEDLADELNLTGGSAWSRLHSTVSSQIEVPITRGDEQIEVPMSVARALSYDPDRATRRAAYQAELASWQRVSVPLAAALNSIKGETNALDTHRGWPSALDLALFNNNIDRQTLDAMLEAARASFPDWRRYMHAKAEALGVGTLAWYDLNAPLGAEGRPWSFAEARDFLLEQFGAYSPRLRDFATRAFQERWIDAEPRPGKVDGAFCMWLRGDQSRVLSNFKPSYDGMSTLAHELGHAYHSFNLAGRNFLQRSTPMTLAETASIFCETIVREAALERADRAEQMSILEASLTGNMMIVVDIFSRFLFEQALFECRRARELSVEELNELMLTAQRETYGDGLQADALHPYMWAAKSHYYSVARPFYNFPYMFGLLFGLGLYARYRQDPERFRAGYDELLSATGLADAAELAARFGIDIRTPEFWTASLDIERQDIGRFIALVGNSTE